MDNQEQMADLDGGQTGQELPSDAGQQPGNDEPQQTALDVMNEALGYADETAQEDVGVQEVVPPDAGGQQQPQEGAVAPVPLAELYTEPEGLAPKSSERFHALVEDNKEQRALNVQMDQQLRETNEDLRFMRETFFTDEQSANDFMQFAGYREALKRGDFDSAIGMLQEQAQQLQLLSGRKLEADPLASYPDLRQQVDDMALDEAHALELARHRAIQAQQQQYVQQQAQQQARQEQNVQQAQQTMTGAVHQINQMEAQWSAQDLNYPAKKQKLMEMIPQIQQTFPPQLWPQQVAMLYQTLGGLTAAPQPTVPRALKNAPLRPTGSGGGRPEPANALEAMNQALNYND